jgi:hypothetical protein
LNLRSLNAMNLPNYFLADLPPEASLTPAMIAEASQTLKRNREQYLARRSTQSLVQLLAAVAASWLRPEDPFRRAALERGPAETGFSRATLERGLDAFFRELTVEKLNALLVAELGHAGRLDLMSATEHEQRQARAAVALGPDLLVHVAAGNLPNPALLSLVTGILMRSAQFMKCASGGALLPRLFAHSLYESDPKLGACLELAVWRGGVVPLEEALFAEAACVTATGSDETLAAIRGRLPARVRFLGYGHRVSFGYVGAEVLTEFNAPRVVTRAAADVTAWDQLGCLSPHVIYVEQGGGWDAERFAARLAEELARRESSEPRGAVPAEVAASIAARRGIYEVRAAHSPGTRQWCSQDSTAWTVVFEADARFQLSCLNRFIYVKPVASLKELLQAADPVRHQVSTIGVAVPEHLAGEVGLTLARWGATRVCPLGRMQEPPLTWRHDGRPVLADLVTWTDLEM